ncbi:MAG: hypothetical protein OXI10_07275, partial [Gammaproteobacteria bacterium]|nr:hypothetical protein [Gammaproteobacteria bacterium]
RQVDVINLGAPDRHFDHGSQQQQLTACGLDPEGIVAAVQNRLGTRDDSGQTTNVKPLRR